MYRTHVHVVQYTCMMTLASHQHSCTVDKLTSQRHQAEHAEPSKDGNSEMDFPKSALNSFSYVACELCTTYFGDIKTSLTLHKSSTDKYCITLELSLERITNPLTRL